MSERFTLILAVVFCISSVCFSQNDRSVVVSQTCNNLAESSRTSVIVDPIAQDSYIEAVDFGNELQQMFKNALLKTGCFNVITNSTVAGFQLYTKPEYYIVPNQRQINQAGFRIEINVENVYEPGGELLKNMSRDASIQFTLKISTLDGKQLIVKTIQETGTAYGSWNQERDLIGLRRIFSFRTAALLTAIKIALGKSIDYLHEAIRLKELERQLNQSRLDSFKALQSKADTNFKQDNYPAAAQIGHQMDSLWKRYFPDRLNPYECFIGMVIASDNGDCRAAEKFSNCFEETYKLIECDLSIGNDSLVFFHLQELDKYFGTILSRVVSYQQTCPDFAKLTYNYALLTKGFLMERDKNLQTLLNSFQGFRAQPLLRKLIEKKREELRLHMTLPVSKQQSLSLEREVSQLVKEVASVVPDFPKKIIRPVHWEEIQQQLDQGLDPKISTAAIEYLLVPSLDVSPPDTTLIAVGIITGGKAPTLVSLGSIRSIPAVLSQNYASANIRGQESLPLPSPASSSKDLDLSVHNFLWKPLSDLLIGINKVYLAPIGELNFISFETIPTNINNMLLGDRLEIHQLFSTRRLAQPQSPIMSDGKTHVFALGNIDYGRASKSNWRTLVHTKPEIDSIKVFCQKKNYDVVEVLEKQEASESNLQEKFRNYSNPSILHFSTHGFYYPHPVRSLNTIVPMNAIGLILSGANRYAHTEIPPAQREDGWLYASEIENMNLANVRLVVIPACKSGLGQAFHNEGVLGLPRAFRKAGAQDILVSLSDIDDEKAKEFIVEFYRRFLAGKISTHNALRETRSFFKHKHPQNPAYWAGWVLIE